MIEVPTTNNERSFRLDARTSITPRPKGHHLSEIERGQIAAWHIEGCSARQIA
ncbi:helix-turn-helix domain-containing protein, partial [Pediococcus acidilactici]|uniref:helix-turn-helix domain-containing protein n=1 Tax=Pediococcus acidilactici TaxID=1254 RepID=UPI00399CA438